MSYAFKGIIDKCQTEPGKRLWKYLPPTVLHVQSYWIFNLKPSKIVILIFCYFFLASYPAFIIRLTQVQNITFFK